MVLSSSGLNYYTPLYCFCPNYPFLFLVSTVCPKGRSGISLSVSQSPCVVFIQEGIKGANTGDCVAVVGWWYVWVEEVGRWGDEGGGAMLVGAKYRKYGMFTFFVKFWIQKLGILYFRMFVIYENPKTRYENFVERFFRRKREKNPHITRGVDLCHL